MAAALGQFGVLTMAVEHHLVLTSYPLGDALIVHDGKEICLVLLIRRIRMSEIANMLREKILSERLSAGVARPTGWEAGRSGKIGDIEVVSAVVEQEGVVDGYDGCGVGGDGALHRCILQT